MLEVHCLNSSHTIQEVSDPLLASITRLQVDQSGLTSELEVFPISPVQLFRNLYIDLSWYAVEGNGRQLQESCGDLDGWNVSCIVGNPNCLQAPIPSELVLSVFIYIICVFYFKQGLLCNGFVSSPVRKLYLWSKL